jgi:two-component system, NarL family, response regulator LiaR
MNVRSEDHNVTIRVILVDDHEAVHIAVLSLLREAKNLSVVGQAYCGEDAIILSKLVHPDVILMDVMLPGMSGAQTTKVILSQNPETKIVALSSAHEYQDIKSMMESGAVGYLIKNAIADSLVVTIRAAYYGTTVFSEEAARIIYFMPNRDDFGLTNRELEVLRLIAQGLRDHEAATQLSVSHVTIRFHLKNILAKMGVTTRAGALVLAAKSNLI